MYDLLLDLVTRKRTHLQLSLRGVDGYTGGGDVKFSVWSSGKRKLEVELHGVAGRVAEIYANGALAATVDLDEGRAGKSFNTQRGDTVPLLTQDASIDVRQNGQIILEGAFNIE